MVTQRNCSREQGDFFRQSFGREHIEKWGNRLRKIYGKETGTILLGKTGRGIWSNFFIGRKILYYDQLIDN